MSLALTDTCPMRLLWATAVFLAVSCGGTIGTPDPSDGPAFIAVARGSTEACGHDVCVRRDVRNMGNRAGSGECRLDKVDHLGGGKVVMGPTVTLPVVAPGETTSIVARWKGTVHEGNVFTLTCDPAPRM